jgi:hypothetical protein
VRVLAKDPTSEETDGCDRFFDGGDDDILVQLRPASAADHDAIAPNYVPDGEILGRVSKAVLLDAARALGLR